MIRSPTPTLTQCPRTHLPASDSLTYDGPATRRCAPHGPTFAQHLPVAQLTPARRPHDSIELLDHSSCTHLPNPRLARSERYCNPRLVHLPSLGRLDSLVHDTAPARSMPRCTPRAPTFDWMSPLPDSRARSRRRRDTLLVGLFLIWSLSYPPPRSRLALALRLTHTTVPRRTLLPATKRAIVPLHLASDELAVRRRTARGGCRRGAGGRREGCSWRHRCPLPVSTHIGPSIRRRC